MLPWTRPSSWLLAGAHSAMLSGPAELPLLHVDGDPRAAVEATVGDRQVVVRIDPFGPSRIGRIAAIRLGLDDEREHLVFDADVGPLHLDRLRAEVVPGEEIVLGLAALPQVASAIDRTRGVLVLRRSSDAAGLGTFPSPLPLVGGRRRWPSGPVAGPIDGAARQTRGPVDGRWRAGRYRGDAFLFDPRHAVPVDPADEPQIGADALATTSVACAPATEACRFDLVVVPWTADPDRVAHRRVDALARAEERASDWTLPEAPEVPTSVPAGDPGSSWQARRWLDLSDAAWTAGDVRRALVAGEVATRAGRDRCTPWMVLGERLLRGRPALDELERLDVSVEEPEEVLRRAHRHLRLHEDASPGYTLRQPEDCRRAAGLWDETRLELVAPRELQTPLARAVAHLAAADPAAASATLRASWADGASVSVAELAVHLLASVELGRALAARATLQRLAHDPDADSLWIGTLAMHAARALDGEAGVRWIIEEGGPAWEAVGSRALGAPRPQAPLRLALGDEHTERAADRLAVRVALQLAREPGDPTAWALARWLGHEPPPGPPSLDDAIVRSWLDDPEGAVRLAGWPLAVATLELASDPEAVPARTMRSEPDVAESPRTKAPDDGVDPSEAAAPRKETEMIPAIALATAALAADFDHSHAAFGTFLSGAVSNAGVDYGTLGSRRDQLDAYLADIAAADASGFDKGQKLALYVNAYNAYTIQTMLDAGPGVSILKLDDGKVWDQRTFPVAGQDLTLNQMEHGNARKLADGRVHAVVNCASKGCPPLPPTPLRAGSTDAQLTAGTKRWADVNAFAIDGSTIALSKIFDWYSEDFANVEAERDLAGVEGKHEQALWFLSKYVDDATKDKLLSGELTATWAEYDWSRNAQ